MFFKIRRTRSFHVVRELIRGLMSRTMAMHVHYKSLYIPLLYGTWTTTANFSYFHLEVHAAIAHLARARFQSHWCTEQI